MSDQLELSGIDKTYGARSSPPNKGRTLPNELFSPQEINVLLAACPETMGGLRLRAYIMLLYRTGIEASEGLSLTYDHLDLSPGQEAVRVPATRLLSRVLALDENVVSALRQWLDLRESLPGTYIFCVIRGRTAGAPWAEADMRRIVRELGTATLGKRLNPGALRYTLTAELILEQWPLPYILTQLGLRGIWTFREIFEKLGITRAPEDEVAEIARARPSWQEPAA